MGAFEQAIYNATCGAGPVDLIPEQVLAVPEMQAIRWALGQLHQHGGPGYLEVGLDLPRSVIDWVTG